MKKIIILYLAFFSLMPYAFAADCDKAETQLELNQCTSELYKEADKKLNQVYQEVLKRTSEKQTNLLKNSQNLWIKYRNIDCKFQSFKSQGGSVYPMVMISCLIQKTKDRTKELKAMLECPEGDATCPL